MPKPTTFAATVAAMAATLTAHAGVPCEVTHRGADAWTVTYESAAAAPAHALVPVLQKIGTSVEVCHDAELEMTAIYFTA